MTINSAGGWCAPSEHTYDICAMTSREYRAKYGWPQDHDPWTWMDDDDIRLIASIIEHGPTKFTEAETGQEFWFPALRVPRGSVRFDQPKEGRS